MERVETPRLANIFIISAGWGAFYMEKLALWNMRALICGSFRRQDLSKRKSKEQTPG